MKKTLTFCDRCGEEIEGFVHNLNYDFWTVYPVDGYHNTIVQLDLCTVCYPKIMSGEKPKPLDEVVHITFLGSTLEEEKPNPNIRPSTYDVVEEDGT